LTPWAYSPRSDPVRPHLFLPERPSFFFFLPLPPSTCTSFVPRPQMRGHFFRGVFLRCELQPSSCDAPDQGWYRSGHVVLMYIRSHFPPPPKYRPGGICKYVELGSHTLRVRARSWSTPIRPFPSCSGRLRFGSPFCISDVFPTALKA